MAKLLAGRLAHDRYAELMRNLHALYTALEAALARHAAHPALGALPLAALQRAEVLARDLRSLPPAAAGAPLAPAGLAYVERLRGLADAAPHRLLAHAYVRYLGDLHGGQIVRRQAARCLGRDDDDAGAGLAFFDFGPPERVLALRQALRQALHDAPLTPEQAAEVVAEACWGFERHVELFEQVAPG